MTDLTALLAGRPGQYYLAAVVALIALLGLGRRLGLVFFITAFPATVAHELMHFVFGWLSYGQPAGVRLWPRRGARGYVLGSVTCHNVRWYNGLVIGLAPLALLPFTALLFRWRVQSAPAVELAELGWVYAVASLTLAALPSWQDLRVALASSWLLLLAALAALAWHLGWLAVPLH